MGAVIRLLACLAVLLSMPVGVVAAEDATSSKVAVPRYLGMHLHRADQGTAWPAGVFGSWRLWDAYVAWRNLEPVQGQWDFSRLDRYAAMARVTGTELLLPLGVPPRWASSRPEEKGPYGPGSAAEPRSMEAWENYVRTVAERYKGRIRDYDLWNEVNPSAGFYTGSTATLVELTCRAQRVLKSVDPANRLVSPSMVGEGSEPELLETYLKAGIGRCIDIVGYHFYELKTEPEKIVPLVARVRRAMHSAGVGHLSLWNTEYGWAIENRSGFRQQPDPRWRVVSLNDLASVVMRGLVLGRALGIERFYWYAWDSEQMGLIETGSGVEKSGARAFRALATWLTEGDVSACGLSDGLWQCDMKAPGGVRRYIVWSADDKQRSFAPAGVRASYQLDRIDGRRETPTAVKVGREPVLVTVSAN